jgi:acyl carrier protein
MSQREQVTMVNRGYIEERTREIVAKHFTLEPHAISSDVDFFEDLSASLDVIEIYFACEEEFGVKIPYGVVEIRSLSELVDLICKECGV